MIRAFLEHHLARARRGAIPSKAAIRHCHASGLHSVMLHDEAENRIRMFFADKDHQLAWDERGKTPMPLAVHSHHCDVTLVGIFGGAKTLHFQLGQADGGYAVTKCRFESAITGDGHGKLTSRGVTRHLWIHSELTTVLQTGQHVAMPADALHTVTVPQGSDAAWLVFEGPEDPDYQSLCYTNYPHWSPGLLYRTPDQVEVVGWIERALEGCS